MNETYMTGSQLLGCVRQCRDSKEELPPMGLILAAGQTARSSGVYKTIHANNHIPPHFVIVLHGETLPI